MTNKIVNLTGKLIKVMQDSGEISFKPEKIVPHVYYEFREDQRVEGVQIMGKQLAEIINLPEPQEDVLYVVSKEVAWQSPERKDLVFVDGLQREPGERKLIGCKFFSFYEDTSKAGSKGL